MKRFSRLKAAVYILQMALFILFLPLTGWLFYRSHRRFAQLFYFNMCHQKVFHMLYCIIFACGISAFNTFYTITTRDFTCASLTLAVSFPFLFEHIGQPLLTALRGSRQLMFFLMVIALVGMFTANLYPFAFALYLLLMAVVFWPSKKAVDRLHSVEGIDYYREHPTELADIYYA